VGFALLFYNREKIFPVSFKSKVSSLIVLFPCTYLIHIAEEGWCGERFFNWLNRVAGAQMTEQSFLLLNGIFLLMMVIAIIAAIFRDDHRIVLILASIISINTLLHTIGSITTRSYSPGLVSALLLWMPLAVWAFYNENRFVSKRNKIVAISIGIGAHIIISILALTVR